MSTQGWDSREPNASAGGTGRSAGALAARLVSRTAVLLVRRIHITIVAGAVGFGIGWLGNVWIMGQKHDGFRVPAGSTATGDGNLVRGSVFWFLLSTLTSAVVAYRLTLGPERFWAEVRELPAASRRAIAEDGDQTLLHLLVGFAGALLAVVVVGPSVSAVLVGVLAFGLARVLRPLVTGACQAVWRAVAKKLAPARSTPPAPVAFVVGALGSAGAFALGVILPGQDLELAIALLAAIAAVVIARARRPQGPASATMSTFLIILGGAFAVLLLASPASADDGGFTECGNPGIWGYITSCTGAANVLGLAVPGGAATAVGAAVGAAAGAAIGEESEGQADGEGDGPGSGGGGADDDDEDDLDDKRRELFEAEESWFTDQARQERLVGYLTEWMAANPDGFDADAFTAYVNKQEESAFYQLNFEIWRSMNPDAPATEFIDSGSWYDQAKAGKRTGNVEDATLETADAISLLMGMPGLVKGTAALGKMAVTEIAERAAAAGLSREQAALASQAQKMFTDMMAKKHEIFDTDQVLAVMYGESPEMVEAWVRSLDDAALKELYGASIGGALRQLPGAPSAAREIGKMGPDGVWVADAAGQALYDDKLAATKLITELISDMGKPGQWQAEAANDIASGLARPPWAAGVESVAEMDGLRKLTEAWLESNRGHITGSVPTVDQLLTRWYPSGL